MAAPDAGPRYPVGSHVVLSGTERMGIVRYYGALDFRIGTFYGIELLDGSLGDCDGECMGSRYFKTDPNRAVFILEDGIKRDMTTKDHAILRKAQDNIERDPAPLAKHKIAMVVQNWGRTAGVNVGVEIEAIATDFCMLLSRYKGKKVLKALKDFKGDHTDFRTVTIRPRYLSGVQQELTWENCSFQYADMSGKKFCGVILVNVDFSHASLKDTYWSYQDKYPGSESDVDFSTSLNKVNFKNADLSLATFGGDGVYLQGPVNLTRTTMSEETRQWFVKQGESRGADTRGSKDAPQWVYWNISDADWEKVRPTPPRRQQRAVYNPYSYQTSGSAFTRDMQENYWEM